MRSSGNTILVTGGGSGIGRELARRFHALGNAVIVAGRRAEPLAETIGGRAGMHAMELDVGDGAAVAGFARRVLAEHPALNVLINNAGIMRYDDLSAPGGLGEAEAQVVTNLIGPLRLTDHLIGHIAARPGAAVVNVSSGLAFVPRADAAVYGATKAALHSLTLSLRERLRGTARVIELVPPLVGTELTPGQAEREGAMPLEDFMEEVMAQFRQDPVPDEILVRRAHFQRFAERENRFDEAFGRLNAAARAQRGG